MKLQKSQTKKHILIVVLSTLIVAGVSLGVWSLYYPQSTNSNTDSSDKHLGEVGKDQIVDDTPSLGDGNLPAKDSGGSDTIPDRSGDGEDTTSQKLETPRIERASQNNNDIKVVASFQKPSSGTCELQLTHTSTTIKKVANIVVAPSYYTCSFSVPVNDLPRDGDWNATVIHERGDAIASSDIQIIEVRR
jgi:hypothetical protein